MSRPLLTSLLLLNIVLSSALAGCTSKSPCTSSAQCANGFACNPESMLCEAEVLAPDASTIDATMACPGETHFCAVPAPEGWSGPMIGTEAASDATLAACPDAFDVDEQLLFSDLVAEGGCQCDCPGVSSGVQCGNATIAAREGTDSQTCNQTCLDCTISIPPTGSCQTFPGGDNAAIFDSAAVRVSIGKVTNTGTCSAAIESDDLSASFAEQARYCAAAPVEASCPAAGTCFPNTEDLNFDSLCVFQSGDQECPAEYPEKRLRFEGIEDTRACSSCTCSGPAVGSSCGGVVRVSPKNVSVNCALTEVTNSSCIAKNPDIGLSASYTPATSFGCNQIAGGELSGEASETGPVTFCCLGLRSTNLTY